MKLVLKVISLFFLYLFLNGCASLLPASPSQPSQLVSSILSNPATFNAVLSTESPNIFGLTYRGLTQENPLTGKIEPALAESWEISEDQRTLIFTLRTNLYWSDGIPLTVDDVIFSYNQLYFNPKIPAKARYGLRVGKELPKVEKIDDRRVKFTVPEPFSPLLGNSNLAILPAHSLKPLVEQFDREGKPLFNSSLGTDTPPDRSIWQLDGDFHDFNRQAQPGQKPITGQVISDWEKQISQLYSQGTKELDFQKRKAIYDRAQELIQMHVPFIYLITPLSMSALRDRVQGVQYSALGGVFWNIQNLTLRQ